MALATAHNQEGTAPATAAAGAADLINVLTLPNGKLATGEIFEYVTVTFSDSFFMVRPVGQDQDPQILPAP